MSGYDDIQTAAGWKRPRVYVLLTAGLYLLVAYTIDRHGDNIVMIR